MTNLEYIIATSADHFKAAKKLFKEYADHLSIDLSFQDFEKELQNIEETYSQKNGGIILCNNAGKYIGCIAVRSLDNDYGEIKRMFVQPHYQGLGIGKALLEKALALGVNCSYQFLRLDTLNYMLPAIHLYKAYEFYEITPYYHNPNPTAVFFERKLNR